MTGEKRINQVFRENLQYYLMKSNKQQGELAQYLKGKASSVSQWVNGKQFPRFEKIDEICDFLNISRAQLVTERREGLYQTILGENEYQVLSKYSSLNIDGKQKILAYIDDLIASHQYDKGMPLKKKHRPMWSVFKAKKL